MKKWYVLGVDPGISIGVVILVFENNETPTIPTLAYNNTIVEDDFLDWAFLRNSEIIKQVNQIVVEDFVLYPWVAQQQAFSNMPASKIIGASAPRNI